MKKLFIMLCVTLASVSLFGKNPSTLSIIPEPVSAVVKEGVFTLPKNTVIIHPAGTENNITLDFLRKRLNTASGVTVSAKTSGKGTIELVLNQTQNTEIGDEGYTLSVTPKKITIRANKPAGLYYGAQTLIQLFPPEIENSNRVDIANWQIPAVEIVDYPRVGWRGMMLDVARHFFTVDEVKRFIDQMSRYKYNMLHWHLTDDEGWRIEIKSLPKLTEVGAWRVEKVGNFGAFSNPLPDEPKTYGGFYTHEQIRDIVSYAQARFIDIMPEVDVPGHSMAAIAAYPELASSQDAVNYSVRAGEPIINWSSKPRHTALKDNNLCPAKEIVYDFMDKVMTEVAQLFPFEYIHAGGDEATYNFWEASPEVAELMKKENLKSMAEVQAYFSGRVEKIIISKGKKMMGWDEILEGGVASSTALMSWRGIQYGIEASKSGHFVVMSPMQHVYIDLMQGDAATDAPVYETVRLTDTYKFNPIPAGADPTFILGGQANLWTEQIYNYRQIEYMVWPRAFAVSESLWSPEKHKNWNNFIRKTEAHFKRFDQAETKYSPAMYDPVVSVSKQGDQYYVTLTPEIEGLDIYTSFDNSTPDYFYPNYIEALLIPKDARLMRIISYRGKQPVGRLMTISTDDLKKRAR